MVSQRAGSPLFGSFLAAKCCRSYLLYGPGTRVGRAPRRETRLVSAANGGVGVDLCLCIGAALRISSGEKVFAGVVAVDGFGCFPVFFELGLVVGLG